MNNDVSLDDDFLPEKLSNTDWYKQGWNLPFVRANIVRLMMNISHGYLSL